MLNMAIVEDNLQVLKHFSTFLKKEIKAIISYEAENGYDFLQKFNPHKPLPQIMLIDIKMPVIDGIALTYFMKVHYPKIKIICCSVYHSAETIKSAFLAGADAYLIKGMAVENMHSAIDAILDNKIFIDPNTTVDMQTILSVIVRNRKRIDDKYSFSLTKRERTFVMLAATTLNYQQIAELMCVDIRTVHTYFEQVKGKLNTPTHHALMVFALQHGLAIHADYDLAA